MKVFQYVYYKIYLIHSKGEDGFTAAGLAIMTISVLFFANIITMGAVLKKTDVINKFINRPTDGIILIVLILFSNYFLFMHQKKYLKIFKRFENETKKQKIIGGFFVGLYVFCSFLSLFLIASYKPGYI